MPSPHSPSPSSTVTAPASGSITRLPPVAGGDVLLQPLNMAPVGQQAPATPPAAKPPTDPAAARTLIEDTARRVLTKESKALTRAAKKFAGKPADLRTWADQFYAAHAPLVVRTFAPALKAAGVDADPADYAKRHCAASLAAVTAGIDAGADALDIADEWTEIRPTEISDSLMKG